jgi:hypothetical protein
MKTIKSLIVLLLIISFCGCREQEVFKGKRKYGLEFERELSFSKGEPLLEIIGGSNLQIMA